MLIGAVIHHEVQDDANAALPGLRGKRIKIGDRPVHGIDILVVGYVVTEVHLGRRETRSNPDGIHSQVLQIIQL